MFGRNKSKKGIKRKDKGTYISVDIGTENVKTVLFRIENDEVEIVGYSRIRQQTFAMHKAIIMDIDEVVNTVDQSIGAAIKHAEQTFKDIPLPSKAIIGIAGELVTGVPIVVNVDRKSPQDKITIDEVKNVIAKVKEHSFESTKEDIAKEIGMDEKQIEEIETIVNSVSIDGVKAKDPIGLSGEVINYRVFSSFAPRVQVESIEKISKQLKLDLQKIVVEPYALATGISEIVNDPNGAIILDIGAGTTDLILVRNGELIGLKMFAIGGRVFTKRIQKELVTTHEEAEDLKIKYSSGSLDDYRAKSIRKALQNDVKSWLIGVEIALDELAEAEEFPNTIYICGGGSYLPDIKEGLMEYPWIQKLNFKKHPKVNQLLPNKISKVKDSTRSVVNPIDVTPVSLARYMLNIVE